MAEALLEIIDSQTVVVASSDFTHHGSNFGYAPFAGDTELGSTLVGLGRTTVERLAALVATGYWYQVEISGDTVTAIYTDGRQVLGEDGLVWMEGQGAAAPVEEPAAALSLN